MTDTLGTGTIAGSDYDLVGKLMDFEAGNMSQPEVIALFQRLVNDGTVWHLQGQYGRLASVLIENGLIQEPRGQTHGHA